MQRLILFLALVLYTLAMAAASPMFLTGLYIADGDADSTQLSTSKHEQGTIIDRLRGDKRFSRFVEALSQERGLRDDLENKDRRATVFAPTNDAFKKMEDDMRRITGEQPRMGDILRYHICPDMEVSGDKMHQGMLLRTGLRLKSLNDRHQRIRVFRFHGDIWLNMRGRMVQHDMRAENGLIHVIDRVLMPPSDAREMLFMLPTMFSTFLAGMERTGMSKLLADEKGLTVFAPSNEAWERLGMENLRYLFSCAGQHEHTKSSERECKGLKDLKRIMQYHMGRELAYSTDMMEKREMRIKTFCEDMEVRVQAIERKRGGGGGDRDRDSDSVFEVQKHCTSKDKDEKQHDVRRYMFLLNHGEARVTFTDGLAENGAIQMIDDVLIPEDMKLPHDRLP